jgi:glycosyltransferase involved in cell wall biosynthesis
MSSASDSARGDGSGSRPRVSIVIPAYHSHATLGGCLESLRTQRYRSFETIVVNSSDESKTGRLIAAHYPEVIFHQAPSRLLPHAARNVGVQRARGALLVFTDPDCAMPPDWLGTLVAAVDAGHPYVVGAIDNASSGWLAAGAHLVKFGEWLPARPAGPARLAPTANVCITRELWERAGPFDARWFAADSKLSWKARALGAPPSFEPGARVSHGHEVKLAGFLRERFRRGGDEAAMRSDYDHWPRWKLAAFAAGFPAQLALTIARTFANAVRGGHRAELPASAPVVILGWGAWILGGAWVYARLARVAGCQSSKRRSE